MTPEKNNKKLTTWLLAATIALLALVLCLQLWQMFGRTAPGNAANTPPLTQDAASPENPQTAGPALSHGKAAMVEDVLSLNAGLSADDLAKLSAEELEQLYASGAPGLPIGVSAAVQAAEECAGTLEVDSVTSRTDPELDEAPAYYEVELSHPTLGEFEYKIDAYTGAVLEGQRDILSRDQAVPQEVAAGASQIPASGPQAPAAGGEEAAKNAAFAHAGVSAADVSGLKCKLDWEDGRQVYEVEFWAGSAEYDYEIDAATGAVVKSSTTVRTDQSLQQSASFVGEEAAKNAAFTHAGVSAADAAATKCELDEDDGRWLYEIGFWKDGVEYDYEIDAATGAVLKAEQDR